MSRRSSSHARACAGTCGSPGTSAPGWRRRGRSRVRAIDGAARLVSSLAATGTLPVTDEFGFIGKLGGLFWGVYSETGLGFERDDTGVSFAMGAGVKYDITPNVGIRFEWERFWQVGNSTIGESDIDMFTVGGLYRF